MQSLKLYNKSLTSSNQEIPSWTPGGPRGAGMVDGWDACELLDTFAKSLHTAAKAGTEAAAWGLSHPCVCPLRLCLDTAHAHVKVHDHESQSRSSFKFSHFRHFYRQ